MKEDPSIKLKYKNHRGVTTYRNIRPLQLFYGTSEWHGEGWIMLCHDLDKGEDREFALKDCDFLQDVPMEVEVMKTPPAVEKLFTRLEADLFAHQKGSGYTQTERTGTIKNSTEKAYCIVTPIGEHWMPKSQCEAEGELVIACSDWIANQPDNAGKFDDIPKFTKEQSRRSRKVINKPTDFFDRADGMDVDMDEAEDRLARGEGITVGADELDDLPF